MTLYFLFNKQTGVFVGFSADPKILDGALLWKKIEIEEGTNLADISWEGDYTSGQFVRKTDLPAEVSEYQIKEKFYDRFFRRYSFEKFTELLLLQIQEMIDSKIIKEEHLVPDFSDMMKFFVKNYVKYLEDVEFFKNSEKHKYMSNEDYEKRLKDQFQV